MLREIVAALRIYIANHAVMSIPSHTIRLWYLRHVMGYQIGERSAVLLGCQFDSPGGLVMGSGTVVNQNSRLDSRGKITIGDNVSISAEVIILTAQHDMNSPDFVGVEKPVRLGNHVFVGTRAMILPGVTIGEGAVVAAGAVVTRDVEPYAVVAGVPARQIGERSRGLRYTAEYRRLMH